MFKTKLCAIFLNGLLLPSLIETWPICGNVIP